MARYLHRRGVLMLAAGTVAIGKSVASASDLSAEAKALVESGFAADTSEKLDLGYRSGLLSGLHAVVVQRNDTILFERYFAGEDQVWARPLGHVTFDGSTLHDLRSVTKSITSLIYAIALARGKVPAPDARHCHVAGDCCKATRKSAISGSSGQLPPLPKRSASKSQHCLPVGQRLESMKCGHSACASGRSRPS